MTIESVDMNDLPPESASTTFAAPQAVEGSHGTYWFDALADVPAFAAVGGPDRVIASGSAHDKRGKLQKNSSETLDVLRHLEEKIRARADELELVDHDPQTGAETLVISYGITARAARTAVAMARSRGLRVGFLGIKSLFPVPLRTLKQALTTATRVVVAEENMHGLYRSVLERFAMGRKMVGVNAVGAMITPSQILSVLES